MSEARRHNKARRPAASKSFSSGMPTTESGGAKLPSLSEQVRELRGAANRNLELAETAFSEDKPELAETRFEYASAYETRASELHSVVCERMILLRERAALARATRSARRIQAERQAAETQRQIDLEEAEERDTMAEELVS